MNDFTQEELQKILNFIESHKQDSYDDMRFSNIINKIHSLIDNYCEHRKSLQCSECGSYLCEKCERMTADDNE
jgi:hypothetical protein